MGQHVYQVTSQIPGDIITYAAEQKAESFLEVWKSEKPGKWQPAWPIRSFSTETHRKVYAAGSPYFDMARMSAHKVGISHFVGASLICGYVWLRVCDALGLFSNFY